MITLENVAKSYGPTLAVRDVNLHIERGELIVLLGTSGCGKTTTLKMINRLIEPTSGRITVDGEVTSGIDPVELRRRIGYVFQGVGLFPHLTVAENIGAVPRLLGWDAARTRKRINELLELVNLSDADYSARFPGKLSGGQRQRVGLARALAAKPKVMLMDEPFGALDPITRDQLQQEFRRIHDQQQLTTILVTHDMTEALLLADRIAVMDAGEIVQVDTPRTLLTKPANEFVESMMQTPKRQADQLEALIEEEAAS